MKKLESLNKDLFENFKEDEITQLNKIVGGRHHTNNGTDYYSTTDRGFSNECLDVFNNDNSIKYRNVQFSK